MATSQTCLDIGDLIDVLDLLKRCGFPKANWYELGLRLGLKKSTLDVIEKNHPHDVSRCMTECLSQWLGRVDNVDSRGGANLDSLSDALRSMNETAVAEKLKHHALINIFNNRHTVLSQSLCDSVGIAWLLYGERMLTQEAVSRVVSASPSIPNQREALLTGVKEAVQTDPNSLHTFANVLCTISTNVSLGQAILDDISKYFPTPEVTVIPKTNKDHVVPQDNTSTDDETNATQSNTCTSPSDTAVASNSSSQPLSPQAKVQVPVSKCLLEDFTSMRMSYGSMFYNVRKIIKQKRCSLKDIKELLSCCNPVLSKKVKKCHDISHVLHLIQNECSLTDIALLHSVVKEMKITEADEHIKAYKAELKEFCNSLSISLCLKERFASIPPLQCETVTFVLDWKPEEHVLKDIEDLLAKASGKLLKIDCIKSGNSISVTCSFPFSDVGFTVLRMIENIHILMGQGLKKLTIGNLTLWRRQDVRQKELKEKDHDLLQHTEVISYIILEEAEYKLRDAISSKEKEAIELKQEISTAQVPEEESSSVQSDTESIKEVEEEPLYEELTVLRSQFNEIKEENKELTDKLSKMKVEYLRSLTSNTGASKVRRGMSFEIDDCKFHLKAMTRPDYQPLVDNKRIIEKLQERITLMNMELITEREHNERIVKDIKVLKVPEEKRQRKKGKQIEEEMCLIILHWNHPVTGELKSSFLEVHKDELLPIVLDKAYETAELAPHIPIVRCRLVKYDYEYQRMEQSLDLNEFQHQTIGQIMDAVGCYSLFLETRKENETFKEYTTETIRASVVALSSGVVGPPKAMRVWQGWTVENLKQHIGEAYNLNSSCMRLVMREKDDWSDTSVSDISNVGGTLKELLNMRGHSTSHTQLLYVSSDPEDYRKGFRISLMYKVIEFHFNSILLDITIPPGPEDDTLTTINRRKERIIMKIISMKEENKGKERKIQVQVDKRITLAQLKEELVPLIGVPYTGFKVYKTNGYELKRLLLNLSELKLIVRLGRSLLEGEHRIKLYLLQADSTELCNFMMESIVAKNTPVREFKKQIIEEAKVQGVDCVLELDKMRLRNKNRMIPGRIYLDELIDASSIREIYVEPLKDLKVADKRQRKKEEQIEEEMCTIILYCNHPVTGKLKSSFLEVHKDELLPTVLDKAYELMELAPHIPIERCRLVKYDHECQEMEQSFDLNEFQHQTIGQIMGVVGYYSLFLETRKENETFKEYNTESIDLRISVIDLSADKVAPAEPMRAEQGWTVGELKQHLGEAYNLNSSCMRLVMREKDDWSDTSVSDISNVGGTLKKILNMRGHNTSLYVSSDPEDYRKEFRDSLMYKCIEFHFDLILLNITIPPGPEAGTPTTTNKIKGRIIMKIISMEEESRGKERKILVQVDKRITLVQLKEELVPLIGVPPTDFIVYGINGYEESLDEIVMNLSELKLIVRLGRSLRIGEYRIKLYLLQVNSTEFCKFMMESIVTKNTPVREFKKQIIEEAKVLGIDCVLELDKMRLRYKNGVYPGRVWAPNYTDVDWIYTSMEMYVEPLTGPEKMDKGQIQMYIIRWRPSQCSVDPIEEIIVDKYNSKHFIKKLSELSGVPAEYISYSEGVSFPVEISCFQIENKLKWYSITSSKYSIGLYDDGYVIYYKDNRETMKKLTNKKLAELEEAERARLTRIREHIRKYKY